MFVAVCGRACRCAWATVPLAVVGVVGWGREG